MNSPVVKFNSKDRPEFFKELHRRVNKYFKDNKISKHANFNMKFKTFFMLSLYFVPLILMLSGFITTLWPMILMWVIMGFGMSGIGLAIMHDANHGSYSKNPRVNQLLGFTINFIGGYHINWKIQHNVLHHTSTNVDGYDDDIAKTGVFRLSPDQKRKDFFRFQAFYAPLLYGLMTIYWLISKDYEQLVRYDKQNLLKGQGLTFRKAVLTVTFNKILYVLFTLVAPIVILPLAWYQVVLGFLLMHFICGLALGLIFQPAHVIEETSFFVPDETGSVENNWAIHQMNTTANFANKSIFFSWFVGGLNYQIEHHLFPNICHVHYRNISSIVKSTAKEFNVPYHQHETFYGAVKSHFSLLYQLGTGKYDQNLKGA